MSMMTEPFHKEIAELQKEKDYFYRLAMAANSVIYAFQHDWSEEDKKEVYEEYEKILSERK